jgi:hypothetical protein
MRKIITQNKNIMTISGGCFLFISFLITGSILVMVLNIPEAMGENLKIFKISDEDSNRESLVMPQDPYIGLKGESNGDAVAEDDDFKLEKTIIINREICGVEDEITQTSFEYRCEDGW